MPNKKKASKPEKLYSVNIMISPDIHKAATNMAHQEDMSFSQYVRHALREVLRKHQRGQGRG